MNKLRPAMRIFRVDRDSGRIYARKDLNQQGQIIVEREYGIAPDASVPDVTEFDVPQSDRLPRLETYGEFGQQVDALRRAAAEQAANANSASTGGFWREIQCFLRNNGGVLLTVGSGLALIFLVFCWRRYRK